MACNCGGSSAGAGTAPARFEVTTAAGKKITVETEVQARLTVAREGGTYRRLA